MRRGVITVFLIAESLIYLTYNAMDILGADVFITSLLKFTGISMCLFVAVVICFLYKPDMNRVLVCLAMVFTVIADVFLLFTEAFLPGLFSFFVVQTIYLIWLCRLNNRTRSVIVSLPVRIICSIVVVYLIHLSGLELNLLYSVAVFYAVGFFDNVRRAVAMRITKRHEIEGVHFNLIWVGLILFMLCDINVALYNVWGTLPPVFSDNRTMKDIIQLLMWFFYLPSQVMLVMSGTKVIKTQSNQLHYKEESAKMLNG